jgi:hypothetical protein
LKSLNLNKTKTKKILVDKKLQKALDSFPKVLKAKEKKES